MKRLLLYLLIVLCIPIMLGVGVKKLRDSSTGTGIDTGITGTTATDRTRTAFEELQYPLNVPEDASVFYVSNSAGGWYPNPRGIRGAGTETNPMYTIPQINDLVDDHNGPMVFLLDPGDTFSIYNSVGWFEPPGGTGGCGDADEICWIIASADPTGAQRPTLSCDGTEAQPPSGDGYVTSDGTEGWLALVNLRFDCPNVPNESLKPIIYNDASMILLNVSFDGSLGTGNTAMQLVDGSKTVAVNVTATREDAHDFDGICEDTDDPYDCCTVAPTSVCNSSNPLFIDMDGGDAIFIGGAFGNAQSLDSADSPTIVALDKSGGDAWFIGTDFLYPDAVPSDETDDTTQHAVVVTGDGSLFMSHGIISASTRNIPHASLENGAAFFFDGAGNFDTDLRLYRETISRMETFLYLDSLAAADDVDVSVWGRCLKMGVQDLNGNGTCYDVFASGDFDDTDVDLDIQLSEFDSNQCTTVLYSWKGSTTTSPDTFRTTAATAITSWLGDTDDANTPGSDGSTSCTGGSCGTYQNICSTAFCASLCTLSLTETMPFTIPDFLLGSEITRWSFNTGGDQNFGAR